MLAAVNGYIDGNRVIVDENIEDWQGRNVVVTILESSWQKSSVEDTVRNMRRGRRYKVVDELEMKIFRP